MVSSTAGYAVIGHTVVGTVDGRHWNPLYLAAENLSYVDAVDANHVWAVGSRSLFTSVDAGRRWRVSPRSAVHLARVHFIDANRGWAVSNNTLLHSTTGGRVWQAVPTPCPVDRVCFDDPQHGWLATHQSVYETSSGGARWKLVFAVRNRTIAPAGAPSDVQCTPANDAWILFNGNGCGLGTCPYIAYRCAASETCTPVAEEVPSSGSDPLQGPGSGPGPFSVIDDHTAVFMGFTGPLAQPMSVMLLTDDGRTRGPKMVVPDGPTEAEPHAVSFTDRDRGWIVDTLVGTAHIIATTNGGQTWSVQYSVPFP